MGALLVIEQVPEVVTNLEPCPIKMDRLKLIVSNYREALQDHRLYCPLCMGWNIYDGEEEVWRNKGNLVCVHCGHPIRDSKIEKFTGKTVYVWDEVAV